MKKIWQGKKTVKRRNVVRAEKEERGEGRGIVLAGIARKPGVNTLTMKKGIQAVSLNPFWKSMG